MLEVERKRLRGRVTAFIMKKTFGDKRSHNALQGDCTADKKKKCSHIEFYPDSTAQNAHLCLL